MTQRTTIKTLRTLVANLNTFCGMPEDAWRKVEGGRIEAVEGCYVLDCAYGGYRLEQLVSKSGGERNITPRYGAAITADLIRAYMDGMRKGRLV